MSLIKKFVFYFLLIFLLLFSILFFDFLLSNTVLKFNHCVKYEEYFYELKKNCSGKYRFKKSFPLVNVFTDKIGQRVGKKIYNKNKNKENIFIFGDSFTYGAGIEYEKTFVNLISDYFKNYNVYNFGVGSYSPTVHLYKLKEAINKNIIPKKVFVFLDLTDVLDEATRWHLIGENSRPKLKTKDIYKLSQKKEKFVDKNFKSLKNISSYINYNLRNLKASIKLQVKDEYKIKTSVQGNFTYTDLKQLDQRFWGKNTFKEGIENIEKNLNSFSKIAQKYNFDFYLVVYPWSETIEYGQEKFNWSNFAKSLCINEKCILIDAIPEFISYKKKNKSWTTDLYFLNDEHFNVKGAKLLSEIVTNRFKNEN